MLELAHLLYQFISAVSWQQKWALCAQFSELPIFHKKQMRYHNVNNVARNVNELLNPNHSPIRPWVSLFTPRTRNVECIKPIYIEILRNRHLPYETIDGKYLSSKSYFLWHQDLINGTVLAVVYQSVFKVKDDFDRIDNISVDVNRSVYFQTTADTQRAVENDLLDTDLLVRLCELRHLRIDCSALETAYPDPIPLTCEIAEVQVVPAPTSVHATPPRLPQRRREQDAQDRLIPNIEIFFLSQ